MNLEMDHIIEFMRDVLYEIDRRVCYNKAR